MKKVKSAKDLRGVLPKTYFYPHSTLLENWLSVGKILIKGEKD
jgi:hypothetical protein